MKMLTYETYSNGYEQSNKEQVNDYTNNTEAHALC